MIDRKKLIYALRCASYTENHIQCIKEKCPYFTHATDEDIADFCQKNECNRSDFKEGFWYGCDTDQMMIDAADMLEGKA